MAGGTRQRRLNIILMHLSEYSRLQAIIVSSCVSSIMVSYQVAPDLCSSRSYSTPTGCPLATKRQEAHRHQPLDSTHSRPGNLERKRSFDDPGAEPSHARLDVALGSFRGANPVMVIMVPTCFLNEHELFPRGFTQYTLVVIWNL